METETLPRRPAPHKHHIFISHSGQQKGFARDLSNRLKYKGYSVFFDEKPDSLPPAQPFPDHIFHAAQICRLAVVVLSHDFLSTRWPMLELCAFADRLASPSDSSSSSSCSDSSSNVAVILLLLFFKITPRDIKIEENLERWRKAWEALERKDSRLNASKCESVVTEHLPRLNGIERLPESEQGEASYLEIVIDAISRILPPPGGFLDPNREYPDRYRRCNIILDKFRELEDTRSSSVDTCILAMYGARGTGKSTLCRCLCDSMSNELSGNVVYLELPTKSDSLADKESLVKEQCSKLLSKFSPYVEAITSMNLNEVLHHFSRATLIKKVFLVVDNLSASNRQSYTPILRAILSSAVLGAGSRIMVVSRSPKIFEHLERLMKENQYSSNYRYAIMEVPCKIKKKERMSFDKGGTHD